MKKKFHLLMSIIVSLIGFTACSEHLDDILSLPKPSVEEINGKYHITFYLPERWTASNSTESIELQFFQLEGRVEPYIFNATLENDGTHSISFVIDPKNGQDLPSGEYMLRGATSEGRKFLPRMHMKVDERTVHLIAEITPMVCFKNGHGTPESPYEISNKQDFINLLSMLFSDPTNCRDVHFIQKDNITLDGSEGMIDENGWFSEPFAGHYDGGGFTINGIYYQGSSDQIGLFRELNNGANISNLTINVSSIRSKGNNIGGLAGKANGGVSIKNCKIMGYIEGNDGVGGLIGQVSPSAAVSIDNVELAVTISDSHDKVGGLIGTSESESHVTLTNITTNSASFEISGHDYVGGLIGKANLTSINIDKANLVHSVYEATDVVTIGGNSCVGGLIGSFIDRGGSSGYRPGEITDIWFHPLKIDNSTVCCPIKASGNRVGGIAGEVIGLAGYEEAYFNNVTSSARITGADETGGFIGRNETCTCHFTKCYVKATNLSLIEVKGKNNVGGFLGWGGPNASYSNIGVSTNVIGEGNYVGGFAGSSWGDIALENFKFESTMKVTGIDYVGGLSGKHTGTITGNSEIGFTYGQASIPKENDVDDFSVKVSGSNQVGGLVGQLIQPGMYAIISKVHSRSEVKGVSSVGGIVGYMSLGTVVKNCSFAGTLNATGEKCGGISGKLEGAKVEHCINYSTINGSLDTGGIIGYMTAQSGNFPNVNYSVNVDSICGAGRVGGIVGLIRVQDDAFHDIVTNCANYGPVTCNDYSTKEVKAFGGIVGTCDQAGARVIGCANHANVYGNLSAHGGGGIAGSMGNDPSNMLDSKDAYNFVISNCINTGNISNSNSSCHLGGILGYAEEGDDEYRPDAAVLGCLNKGDITSKQESTSGGIVGELDWYGHIEYCSCIPTLSYGYHIWEGGVKYDALLYESYRVRNNATFINADASHYSSLSTTYWELPAGTGYARLKNCPFQDTVYQ